MLNSKNEKYTYEYLKEAINILDGNEVYRITDILKCHCKEMERPFFIHKLLTETEYEGTIMRQYVERTQNGPFDYMTLRDIVSNHKHKIDPYDDKYVVVHVRTGDDYNDRGLGNPRNRKIYLNQFNKIPKDKIIILVTTMHYGHAEFDSIYSARTWVYSEESRDQNLKLLHDFIKDIPQEVKIQSSIDTDIDFLHLLYAENVVLLNTTGGLSIVVDILHRLLR